MPHWMTLIILSAVALGFYDICKKHAVYGNSLFHVLFLATLTGSTVFVIFTLLTNPQAAICTSSEYLLIWVKSIIVAISWILGYYALQLLPISLVGPVRSTAPLWTLLGSILLYSEIPNFGQMIGMVTIFGGYYLLSRAGQHEGYAWNGRGMIVILMATIVGACSALFDKYLVSCLAMNRITMQFHFSIDLAVIFGIIVLIPHRRNIHSFKWRWSIPATGLLLILADWLFFYALSVPDSRISILSLMRRCNCIITFGLGAWLFKDTNVKEKAWCLAVILAGTTILAMTSC